MTPDSPYNIALDCIDKHAQSLVNKHKTALLYLKEEAPGKLREPPLRLSFSSLQGLSNAAANMFRDLGVRRGERVVLQLPNGPEFPINFLGAIKAGAIPIPLSPLLTAAELEFALGDSESACLVTSRDDIAANPPASLKHVLILIPNRASPPPAPRGSAAVRHRWQDLLKNASAHFETESTPGETPAFWLYTSGTTARPKAVIHAHRSIPAHDIRAQVWQNMKAGDVIFNTSSLHWSYALTCGMLDVWRHGLTSLVFQGNPTAENIRRIVKRHGVTTFMSVPGIYRRLTQDIPALREAFSQVRVCLSAGEKLPEEIRAAFHEATGLQIHEGLGMTEHSVYLVQPFGQKPIPDSCGKALPDQRIAVLREDLQECGPDEVGTLATHRSCAGLMLGYHERPEESAAALRGEWFLSGDLAKRNGEGDFYFLGRNDDLVNAGGYRISPLEVESALNAHPHILESAVVGVESGPGKTLVQAFVVLAPGVPATQETERLLLAAAAERLAKYKIPRQLVFLRELPKTPNGKLRRSLLRPKA